MAEDFSTSTEGAEMRQSLRLIIAVIVMSCIFGSARIGSTVASHYHQQAITQAQHQNDLWEMVQGTKPLDSTPADQLATILQPYASKKTDQKPADIAYPADIANPINEYFGGDAVLRDFWSSGQKLNDLYENKVEKARAGQYSLLYTNLESMQSTQWYENSDLLGYAFLVALLVAAGISIQKGEYEYSGYPRRGIRLGTLFDAPRPSDLPAWIGVVGLGVSVLLGLPLYIGISWVVGWFVANVLTLLFYSKQDVARAKIEHQQLEDAKPYYIKELEQIAADLKSLPDSKERTKQLDRIQSIIEKSKKIPIVRDKEFSKTESKTLGRRIDTLETNIDEQISVIEDTQKTIREVEESAS